MKVPNSGGERAPTIFLPNEVSSLGNGINLIECLANGTHGNAQRTQAVAKAVDCYPQIDGKIPLLKTTPTQYIEREEVKLVPA